MQRLPSIFGKFQRLKTVWHASGRVRDDGTAKHPELKCSGRMVGDSYLGITSEQPVNHQGQPRTDRFCGGQTERTGRFILTASL
jgi:hypothetical protein